MSARLKRVLLIAAMCATVFGAGSAHAQAQSPASRPSRVPPAPHAGGAAPVVAASPDGVVNINSASEDELQRLPGIGPARATAIVALRQRMQHFHAADDLLRVRGIGHVGLRRLRPYVAVAGATTLAVRPGRRPAAARHADQDTTTEAATH